MNIKKYIEKGKSPEGGSPGDCLFQKIITIYKKFINFEYLPFFISLPIWIINDLVKYVIKRFKKEDKIRLYGIYGFFGLWGQGKTIGMTKTLYDLRKKYGDKIYIFTNYGFEYEDKIFSEWQMLLEDYDKPAVFAWDEVQNEFNSREFKKFPTELLTILTQNRKGNGKRIYYTAQRWGRVDKVFRELTHICYQCRTHFGRLTLLTGYHWEDFEEKVSLNAVNLKMKIKPQRFKMFVQSDNLRNMYDSYKMLQSAKTKEYLDRNEIKNLRE